MGNGWTDCIGGEQLQPRMRQIHDPLMLSLSKHARCH